MLTAEIPTLSEIETAIKANVYVGAGVFRSVYRIPNTPWVVKVDYDGKTNRKEYNNRERLAPSLTKDNVRFPEMHLVGKYLIAEYVQGRTGDPACKNNADLKDGWRYHYSKGCARKDSGTCPENGECWAEATKEVSECIADVHQNNVIITEDKIVYVIDLGEH